MTKYETVIHIVSEGHDRYDAGERAGDIIDGSKLAADMMLFCEPTRIYRNGTKPVISESTEDLLVSV
jgi:hypothetical protein